MPTHAGLSKSLKLVRGEGETDGGSSVSGSISGKDSRDGSKQAGNTTAVAAVAGAGPQQSSSGMGLVPIVLENHKNEQGSKSNSKVHSYKLTGETGSYRYMAPEVFRHELYNHKVDQYGFAMIAYQLFEGLPPFAMLNPVQAARAAAQEGLRPVWGKTNRHGKVVPQALRELVQRCWDQNYELRPEMTEVITVLESIVTQMPLDEPVYGQSDQSGCCIVQ
jgi:serine/threonine protein kinase